MIRGVAAAPCVGHSVADVLASQGLNVGLCSVTYSLSKSLSGTQFLFLVIENNSLYSFLF